MTDPFQEQLIGHLLGALEDPEEAELSLRLRTDWKLRARLAQVRGRLELLEAGRFDVAPPPGLAERACLAVASQAESETRRRPMTAVAAPPSSAARFHWLDLAAAAAILAAMMLLSFPAVQSSRFNAQLTACQGNLGQIGVAMLQYSQRHAGYFPSLRDGRGSRSPMVEQQPVGICAALLVRGGYVTEGRWFVCPGSPSAQDEASGATFRELQTAPGNLDDLRRWMVRSYAYHQGYIHDGIYCGTKNLYRAYFAVGSDVPSTDPATGRQSRNHGGLGQNVLLECGSVRFVTTPRLLPQADDIYASKRGLVEPGVDVDDSVIFRPFAILVAH